MKMKDQEKTKTYGSHDSPRKVIKKKNKDEPRRRDGKKQRLREAWEAQLQEELPEEIRYAHRSFDNAYITRFLHNKVPRPQSDQDYDEEELKAEKVYHTEDIKHYQVFNNFKPDTVTHVYAYGAFYDREAQTTLVALTVALLASSGEHSPTRKALAVLVQPRLLCDLVPRSWLASGTPAPQARMYSSVTAKGQLKEVVSTVESYFLVCLACSRRPAFSARGRVLQSRGLCPKRALGVFQLTPKVLKVNMAKKRHHEGVGYVGDPGIRYRKEEPTGEGSQEASGFTKSGRTLLHPECTEQQYKSYIAQLRTFMNAYTSGCTWQRDFLLRSAADLQQLEQTPGIDLLEVSDHPASFSYPKISVGLNFGAGYHLDTEDEHDAIWALAGRTELAFPSLTSVGQFDSGDVVSFDARLEYHACVAMTRKRQGNAVGSGWKSAKQVTSIAREAQQANERRQRQEQRLHRQDLVRAAREAD